MFQPTDKVTIHSKLRISIPQKCEPNFVFSHFTGSQPWYCHLLNSDESDNSSDSFVTTYAFAVGNCSLINAHVYDIRWVESRYG
jgi:hypothetical protein